MSAAAVATKTPAATAMAGAKTNNNQLKAACHSSHATAKLLPPSCHHRCQAACYCRAAAAAAALPLPLLRCCHASQSAAADSKVALPPSCCLHCCAATSAATQPPPPLLPCRRATRLRCAFATAGPLPLPMPRCCQWRRRLCFNHHCHCCHRCRFHHCCRHCF